MKPTALILGCALVAGLSIVAVDRTDGWAQQKQQYSSSTPASSTKYTKQHVIDVGDVPGHQIRIYEIHRTYAGAANPPAYDGVKVVETWTQAFSDYVDMNGHTWGYTVSIMENGDKVYSHFDGTSHTSVNADGSKLTAFTGVTRLVGGTGKFQGIRGLLRTSTKADIQKGLNEAKSDGEYWFEGPAATAATGSTSSGTSGAVAPASAPQPAASPK